MSPVGWRFVVRSLNNKGRNSRAYEFPLGPNTASSAAQRSADLIYPDHAAELYLELMKKSLLRTMAPAEYRPLFHPGSGATKLGLAAHAYLGGLLSKLHVGLYRRVRIDKEKRLQGADWPAEAETMIGLHRLDQLQRCVTDVLKNAVPGDLIETGVWRGWVQ